MIRIMRVAFPVGILITQILEWSGIFDRVTDKMGIKSHIAIAHGLIGMLVAGLILGVIALVMSLKKPKPKSRREGIRQGGIE